LKMRLLGFAKKLVQWFSTKKFRHEFRECSQIHAVRQPFNDTSL
jgi:hypothetical protein